jgi:hypothetical protein
MAVTKAQEKALEEARAAAKNAEGASNEAATSAQEAQEAQEQAQAEAVKATETAEDRKKSSEKPAADTAAALAAEEAGIEANAAVEEALNAKNESKEATKEANKANAAQAQALAHSNKAEKAINAKEAEENAKKATTEEQGAVAAAAAAAAAAERTLAAAREVSRRAAAAGEGGEARAGDVNLPSSILLEPSDPTGIRLARTFEPSTTDQILWTVIKDRTQAVGFTFYKEFMDRVLLSSLGKAEKADANREWGALERIVDRVNAYDVLTLATELFMMVECGLVPEEAELSAKLRAIEQAGTPTAVSGRQRAYSRDVAQLKSEYLQALASSPEAQVLPYYSLIIERLEDLPNKPELATGGAAYNYGILRDAATNPPMIELIWSYWHEQGMLVQTMAAIATRFENRRIGSPDPLTNLNLDPLRGANNLIWGWIQQEPSRLTVRRRAYEYDHQYGLSLYGRAVPRIDAADSRSKFLRCFHELLGLCVKFYEADDDTTVVADPFPVLNALKEVHMVLAEGAHNQFGDLPWTSRVEMMIMEWILARPEFREFLGGRTMVPYEETWMDRVDSMRQLQGWGDTSVSQFRDLGVYGEQILLSIRYGNWMTNATVARAANWARTWREQIQVYIHAYRTVTSVDLTAEPVDARAAQARFMQPSAYLRQQEAARMRHQLPAGAHRA